jgi:hypothetical protein
MEVMDLAELNVVYDHSDDGELMQMLFGVGGAWEGVCVRVLVDVCACACGCACLWVWVWV